MDKNNNLIDFIPSKLIKTYSLQDDGVEVISSIEKNYKLKHNKTKSRAIVVQSLYESDVSKKNPLDILRRNCQGKKLDKEHTDFMELLVNNFTDKKHMINDRINSKLLIIAGSAITKCSLVWSLQILGFFKIMEGNFF